MAEGTLLLVHGFPFDGRMWTHQEAALGSVRRVIAADLPGHGRDGSSPETSMDGMARALATRLDAEGIDAVDLGGLSMGGYVCFAFWRLFPGRVRSLALIDTKSGADNEAGRKARDDTAASVREKGVSVLAESMMPRLFTEAAPADARELAQRMILETQVETAAADLTAMRDRPDSATTLATITVPTLVVVGDADPITPPAESEAMAAAIPGARLVIVPGASHLAPMERPEAVNQALRDFLG
jgi:3-oxoadipate enol-lactonase